MTKAVLDVVVSQCDALTGHVPHKEICQHRQHDFWLGDNVCIGNGM